ARLEIAAQFLVVVNFAVKDDPDVSLFVADRLMPALHIDDAEPAHCQTDAPLDKKAGVIGAAVHNLLVHFCQRLALHATRIKPKNSADPAHNQSLEPAAAGCSASSWERNVTGHAHTRINCR